MTREIILPWSKSFKRLLTESSGVGGSKMVFCPFVLVMTTYIPGTINMSDMVSESVTEQSDIIALGIF